MRDSGSPARGDGNRTPVIAANTGAYAAMIEPGANGYIFPVDDTNMFQQHLETLMGNPESIRLMANDCQRRQRNNFRFNKK